MAMQVLGDQCASSASQHMKTVPNIFKIECPGNETVHVYTREKMTQIKKTMKKDMDTSVTNTVVLDQVFEFWLAHHTDFKPPFVGSYVSTEKDQWDHEVFVTAKASALNLATQAEHHGHMCMALLQVQQCNMDGHAGLFNFRRRAGHCVTWKSSPYTSDGKFLVNDRMRYGYLSSGLLHTQYETLVDAAHIDKVSEYVINQALSTYAPIVATVAQESCERALDEEINQTNQDPNEP